MKYYFEQLGLLLEDPKIELSSFNGKKIITNITIEKEFDIQIRLSGINYNLELMLSGLKTDSVDSLLDKTDEELIEKVLLKITELIVSDEEALLLKKPVTFIPKEVIEEPIVEKGFWQKIFG